MPDEAVIWELSKADFLAAVSDLTAIYGAAMEAKPEELPTRRAIMERHAANPGFRALGVTEGNRGRFVAFTYGFRGVPGQWWHDVVKNGLISTSGPAVATQWLDYVLEVAEVHVRPEFQARGIGRRMVVTLAAGRAEHTAVLSTRDADTPAHRLYRSLGFTDLLRDFVFPGGGPPYAVMGARLPLTEQPITITT